MIASDRLLTGTEARLKLAIARLAWRSDVLVIITSNRGVHRLRHLSFEHRRRPVRSIAARCGRARLEQFPIRRNWRGFSNWQRSDLSCVLAKEAGMHGPGAFP